MMKTLIIEDELPAAKNLQYVLDEVGGFQVIKVLESISETIEWFRINSQPDILFLDIHLADGSAFEIFRHVTISCPIIFTTAYDEYALKAFKVNSVDYLLKPIEAGEVKNAINKLKGFTSGSIKPDLQSLIDAFRKATSYKTHFLIPLKGDKLLPVQTSDIACFFIDAGIVKARTFDGRTYTFESTLDELANNLDPANFFRANRQFILARNAIKDIDHWFNSRLSVNLKVPVPGRILISKARVHEFKDWFSGVKTL